MFAEALRRVAMPFMQKAQMMRQQQMAQRPQMMRQQQVPQMPIRQDMFGQSNGGLAQTLRGMQWPRRI